MSRTRRPNASFSKSWGGVVVIARSSLPLKCRDDLSGPDFLVLQMHNVLIFNVYLAPENSDSLEKLESDPCDTLESSLILARNAGFWIIILGDINARTASVVANVLYDPRRTSPDAKISTRGRWWCRLLNYQDMVILNGVPELGPGAAKFTSFQGQRRTVIDYAAVSRELLPKLKAFEIADKWDGFDHASLGLHITLDTSGEGGALSLRRPKKRPKLDPVLPSETHLDKLLIAALRSAEDAKNDTSAVYGVVTAESAWIKVAVHGHCAEENRITAAAGAATYWGPDAADNTAERVFGAQTRLRAEIHAILMAIRDAKKPTSLQILTESSDAIHEIVYCAADNKRKAWCVPNGDLLQVLAEHIRVRKGRVLFAHIRPQNRGTPVNGHLEQARTAAEAACRLPRAKSAPRVPWAVSLPVQNALTGTPKVSADLSEKEARPKRELPKRDEYPEAHRGRDRQAAIQLRNYRKVEEAPNIGSFWRAAKQMMDPKPLPMLVTADSLRNEFEMRSNAPTILPQQFDANTYSLNRFRAASLPDETTDSTPEQFFSREFEAEIEIPKLIGHLGKHPSKSATGEDAIRYKQLGEMPEHTLANLYNECIAKRDVPSAWLKATTVGILKPGKPATDPASYRLVVLESCGLKGLTTLVHMRITEWCNTRNLIPPWQNGFRENFRTNNNPFVLRCAKEWANANGHTLHVAYVDFSNAFPWTHQETLWLKLQKLGMSGPIFDWLRMLYSRMEYYVKHGDTTSEHYKALLGLLTGDPASPGLWNLFLSDLWMVPDADDVILAGVRIALLAQADDLLLLSLSAEGLRRKLATLATWCRLNFVLINLVKTVIMIFGGSKTAPKPSFSLGGRELRISEEERYVGVHMSSATHNMFEKHYEEKAKSANASGHGIFGLEDSTGPLTAARIKTLYMARVDPHLTHACEVMPDSENVHVEKLRKVQISILRRMLRMHKRSETVPLYTETGIAPIRVRRLLLTLRNLGGYLLKAQDDELVRAALNSSIDLAESKRKSWALDLIKAAQGLDFECPPLALTRTTTADDITAYMASVNAAMHSWFQTQMNTAPRLYLLRDRVEPQKDKAPHFVALKMRHYLSLVKTADHRRAITTILTSTHRLAIEILRYADHGHPHVPRHQRLCRLCYTEVESPEHALLECEASPVLADLRREFLQALFKEQPYLERKWWEETPESFVKSMIYPRPTIARVAKFMFDVLEVFYAVPVLRPIMMNP